MVMFGKPQQVFNNIGNFFKKNVSAPSQSFFKKGGTAEQVLDTGSGYLGKAGRILGDINREAGKVLNSDIATGIANLAGPEGLAALNGLRGGNQAIGLASNLANQGSQITNRGNYSGSSGDVATNILERSKRIVDTGETGHNIQFQ